MTRQVYKCMWQCSSYINEHLQLAVPLLAEFLPGTFPLKLHRHLQQFLENIKQQLSWRHKMSPLIWEN